MGKRQSDYKIESVIPILKSGKKVTIKMPEYPNVKKLVSTFIKELPGYDIVWQLKGFNNELYFDVLLAVPDFYIDQGGNIFFHYYKHRKTNAYWKVATPMEKTKMWVNAPKEASKCTLAQLFKSIPHIHRNIERKNLVLSNLSHKGLGLIDRSVSVRCLNNSI